MIGFVSESVLKRDIFSETHKGFAPDDPGTPVIRRVVTASPLWSRPLARLLARREIAALKAAGRIEGTPHLIATDRDGLYRTWTEGTPLHLARPADPEWYRSAGRLLSALRRAGLTHNDLAKPQNWLMTPDGGAAVIDFQLASRHRGRGPLFRLMAYEDFRHLLKQKRAYAPELLTPTGARLLARRSLPSRIWMATGKKVYNLVTRGLFRWSDGEGTGDRIETEGPAIVARLAALPGVRDVALLAFPLPRKVAGIYAFVEIPDDAERAAFRAKAGKSGADLVQPVAELPRGAGGAVREDLLRLISLNLMSELELALEDEPDMLALTKAIAADRRNMTDRRLRGWPSA